VLAGKGRLVIDESRLGREKLKVHLDRLTEAVSDSSFGDPVAGTTRYDVCIYDASAALVGELSVDRALDVCGSRSCWRRIPGGRFEYRDPDATAHGVRRITAKSGGTGRGKVRVMGRNKPSKGQYFLPTGIAAALQGQSQATVQVVTSDAACFELTTDHVGRADGKVFRASAR
jgi:hypothetical protein